MITKSALEQLGGFEKFQKRLRKPVQIQLTILSQKDPDALRKVDEYFAQININAKAEDLAKGTADITYNIFSALMLGLNLKEPYKSRKYRVYKRAFKESDEYIETLTNQRQAI